MASPARFSSGVNNRPADHPLFQLTQLDPTRNFTWFDDFDRFTPAGAVNLTGWFVTQSASTLAPNVAALANGVVTFAATGAAAFSVMQWASVSTPTRITPLLPVAGKKFWMRSRFKVAIGISDNVYVGAAVATVDPFGTEPADQFVFRSLNAAPEALMLAVGKTNTTEVTVALGTTASDTWSTCTAYYDGKDTVSAWREDDTGLILAAGSVSVVQGTLLPDALMSPTVGMQNKAASNDLFSIDSLLFVSER